MNFASILVLCIVAVLFVRAIISIKRTRTSKCGGNCSECTSRCGH